MTGQSATLIYLHGFNSSPQAAKAGVVLRYLQKNGFPVQFITPWIPSQPLQAADYLTSLVEEQGAERVRLIGSSLGGFYASYLTEKYGIPSVLINPAVRPYELMAKYLGENKNPYSDEIYCLTEQHIEAFRELNVERLTDPEKVLLMVQKGDETLNYQEAVEKYSGSPQIVEEGGDHHFQGFDRWLPRVLEFLKIEDKVSQQDLTKEVELPS